MELIDLIDENDNVIGTTTREEAHSEKKLFHRTVHFTLINEKNEILITTRSRKKTHDGGKLCFLGEHVQQGESYEEAVSRGIKEELGFETKEIKYVMTEVFEEPTFKENIKFFLAKWSGEEISFDENEIEDIKWVSKTELKDLGENVSRMTQYWIDNIEWSEI